MMNKYYLDSRWKPTRSQILHSYRVSAHKHSAEQLGGNHLDLSPIAGLFNPQYRLQKLQFTRKFKKST